MLALELKKLPCLLLGADGAALGWNDEWSAALGKADWAALQLHLDGLVGDRGPHADDIEVDMYPCAATRRRLLVQPLHQADGGVQQWLAYLLPDASGQNERELIAGLPLRTLMGLGSNHFFVANDAGELVLWNRTVEQAAGLGAAQLAGLPVTELFRVEEKALIDDKLRQVMQRDVEIQIETQLRTADGGAMPFLFCGSRFECAGKLYMVSMGMDISQRRRDEQTLRLRERALHATTNGIVITRCAGPDNPIEYVNPAFEAITGYSSAESVGRDSRFMAAPGVDEGERTQLREAIRQRRQVYVVFRNRRKNGELFWNALNVTPVSDERGVVTHYIGVLNDVTATKQHTCHLEHEVNHDALTGLVNRTLLWDRIEQSLSVAQRNKSLVAVLLVDLNKFKQINDTLGHEAGDEVLKVVARRLQSAVRESDTVARLSGDEFVLVLTNQPSLRFTMRMVQRIRASMMKPVILDSKELIVAGSIGVSLYPHDGASPFELVRAADTAMYHAKAAGGKEPHYFSPAMKSTTEAKQKLENDLRFAIEHHQLYLVYQPRMCLRTGRIMGVEALLRWRHPELGILTPGEFLADAEENGLIVPVGGWVMVQVCLTLQRLRILGLPDLPVSMKASYREFIQENFVRDIGDCLGQHRLVPATFELNVTESHLIRNRPLGIELARESFELGIHLGIDDMGDGESNLAYLHHLPIHHLKIAQSPVREICPVTGRGALAKSIIDLAHNLDIRVVAKGVETPHQRNFLSTHGCDELQGNYFSMPLSQEALEQFLGATVG